MISYFKKYFLFFILIFIIFFEIFFLNFSKILAIKGSNNIKDKASQVKLCQNLENSQKLKCWEDIVNEILKQKETKQAFALIETLYNTEPQFRPECHSFVHLIGEKAYEMLNAGDAFNLPLNTTFCGYGFYHGFSETLATKKGSVKQARDFCSLVQSQLGDKLPDIVNQCYHGFGHGSVDIHNEAIWGDERKMLQPAIKLCSEVADTPDRLFRCGTGAFDAISIGYFNHQYKLSMNKNDPFWVCREQQRGELKKSCYGSLKTALLLYVNLDLSKAAKFIEEIPEDDYATLAMGSLALPIYWIENESGKDAATQANKFYSEKGIDFCRSLQPRLHLPCIQSLAYALTMHESSILQYKEGLTFCHSDIITEKERNTCLSSVWTTIKVMYPREKVLEICKKEGNKHDKKFCTSNI